MTTFQSKVAVNARNGLQQKWGNDTDDAWKSIGVAWSNNNGASFSKGAQIIRSGSFPEEPQWGGAGDHAVIWDYFHGRWLCFYTAQGICAAASYDPEVKKCQQSMPWHEPPCRSCTLA